MNLDIEALKSLVGLAQNAPEAAIELLNTTGATADDVEKHEVKIFWAAVEERVRRREKIDAPSLAEALRKQIPPELVFEVCQGAEIGSGYPRLEALRERSARRSVTAALKILLAQVELLPLGAIGEEAKRIAGQTEGARGRVRSCVGDTMRILDAAESAWKTGRPVSLPTGWKDFDAELRLIGNLHVIGAHPGAGKSAIVAGLVHNWTSQKIKVGVLAYEDDALDLQKRILACKAGLTLAQISGDVQPHEGMMDSWATAHEARVEAEKYLFADDAKPAGALPQVLSSIRRMHSLGCRVVILDNMSCVRMDQNDERHLALEEALVRIREAAVELKIPVILIGHLKRSQSDADELQRKPKLSDFAGAAAWERMSRSACGMWLDGDEIRLKILKQTNGKMGGEFLVKINRESAVVTEITRLHENSQSKQQRSGRYHQPNHD